MANGKVGAPLGNRNSANGRQARRALELALEHYPKVPKVISKLEKLIVEMWHPIIRRALEEGDLLAMKEINDRLDGKPAQAIALTGEDGGPIQYTDAQLDAKIAALSAHLGVKPKNEQG